MLVLIIGVLLFAGVHFIPSLAPGVKSAWQAKLGENGYKGIFSLLLLGSFALMIMGWRSSQPQFLYALPGSVRHLSMALSVFALLLFVVSNRPSRLRGVFRHPQLSGVAIWAIAHLLVNGDSRSLVLFGGLLLWSVVEIITINRRDGAWQKDATPPVKTDIINVVVTAVVVAVVVWAHPWLSGVALY